LTEVQVFVWTMECLSDSDRNLACGVGVNLDYGSVKTATGNFDIVIITLGHIYFILSSRPMPPLHQALPVP
jgi:hypothetical protein